jgi:alpha-beta hydrolase superfamily lysophospholipase
MITNEFKLEVSDGTEVHVFEWLPDDADPIRGVIQISHGMAEHAKRYEDFANHLCTNGFAVYSHDLRGHGKTAGDLKNVGFVKPHMGWDLFVSDFRDVGRMIS